MTTDPRSPDQIEHDLARRREHLGSAMDELQQRFSPGQLVDQAMGYVRAGGGGFGGDFGGNLARTVRDNPVPVTLIGAGLAWLMATSLGNGGNRGAGRDVRDDDEDDWLAGRYQSARAGDLYGPDTTIEAGELYPDEGDQAEIARESSLAQRLDEVRASISQRSDESAQAFRERLDQARGAALDLQRRADESAADYRERVDQHVAEFGRRVASRRQRAGARMQALGTEVSARTRRGAAQASRSARGVRDEAVRRGRDAGRAAGDLVRDQPLLLGLVGCAIGAGLAAMLPVSRHEDALLGPHRDRLRDDGRHAADEAMARVERVGTQTAQAADAAARREGLTVEEARETGRDLGRDLAGRVSRVAETTVDTARQAGRDAGPHEAGQPAGRDTPDPTRG
jgi:ElaB/YqjD/DUF883 family membrane-anchored ribosome-binding protein